MASPGRYNTNLASEYYVLSVLYRLGLDAYLTLGNKKSVDIIIRKGTKLLTVDVKGTANRGPWPMDNYPGPVSNHFYTFVSFKKRMGDPTSPPDTFVVRSTDIDPILYRNPKGNRQVVQRSKLETVAKANDWDLLAT